MKEDIDENWCWANWHYSESSDLVLSVDDICRWKEAVSTENIKDE